MFDSAISDYERAMRQRMEAAQNDLLRQAGLSNQLAGLGQVAARQQAYQAYAAPPPPEPKKPKTYREELQADIDEWLK